MIRYENRQLTDGRWTYTLIALVVQEDGHLPMIRKTAFAPAEWYEYGLRKDDTAYETYRWCENDLYAESSYTKRISKKELIREFETLCSLFSRNGQEEEVLRCRKMTEVLQRLIEAKILPLTGTPRERIETMLELARQPVSQEEIVRFCEFCKANHFPLHPHAALFFQTWGHLFYSLWPVFDTEQEAADFWFSFCCDNPELTEDMKEDLDRFSETVSPIGSIGYYYPASVYMAEDGRLLCIHDYEDEIREFRSLAELLESELVTHMPRGLIQKEELI